MENTAPAAVPYPRLFDLLYSSLAPDGWSCDHEGCQGLIEFRCISNTGYREQIFVPFKELAQRWVSEIEPRLRSLNEQGYNIYFGVNLRAAPKGDGASVCPTCRCLWADLDYTQKEIIEKNVAPLQGYNLLPSTVIASGHGFHFYWALKEGIAHESAQKLVEKLESLLAGDHVSDRPRVLRVPGFLNVKDAAHPVLCKEIRYTGKQFSASDFDVLEPVAPGMMPPGKVAPKPQAAPAAPKAPMITNATPLAYGNGHGFMYLMARAVAPFWDAGTRHKLCLGLAGLMRKDEVPEAVAREIVNKLCAATGDPEVTDRMNAVRDTYAAPLEKVASSSAVIEALGQERSVAFFKQYNGMIKSCPPPPLSRPTLPDLDLYAAVPPGSIFDKYVQYAWAKTDAPIQYHVAAIVTVAAAALGNRVSIPDFHGSRLFPNLFTLITGPSSRFRKSTSINIVHGIAKGAEVQTFPNNATVEQLYVKMAPNECEWREEEVKSGPCKGTKKKIAIAWEGKPQGIIYHREFANYLSSSNKSYMQGHRDLLTDLYDGVCDRDQSSKETKTQGKHYITDPAISMLCAVTPVAMREFCTRTDIGSGFLSRFLVITHPEKHQTRHSFYRAKKADLDAAYEITQRVGLMSKCQGEMDVTQEAEAEWVKFDCWVHEQIEEIEGTPMAVLDSFLARLSVMAIKIAMVYAWGTRMPAGEITGDDMKYAVGLCTYSARALRSFFDSVRPEDGNREVRYRTQVLESARGILRRDGVGPIAHRRLLQNSNLDSEQFNRAVSSLVEEGRFVLGPTGHGRTYILNEE